MVLKKEIISGSRLLLRGFKKQGSRYVKGDICFEPSGSYRWTMTIKGSEKVKPLIAKNICKFEHVEKLKTHQAMQIKQGKVMHASNI